MVLGTSALLAILRDELERRAFNVAIEGAETRRLWTASLVETSIVVEARHGSAGLRGLNLFLDRVGVELMPVDAEQAHEARRAFSRFGKGRHAAGLDLGDCLSYALARVLGEPLLFKGDDFAKTDVTATAY